ncbi:YybH family protein [Arthrobacter sp. 35W]|uniref:YybH family protein n=1 Tax=Arthrobacter sp. 35W TaxID=1132441 RepID=UPI000416B6D6|nr:nuclear transport factor 2 family protein [Arthrobacter sp. 35W]
MTLFGAVVTQSGPDEVAATFDVFAARFSQCTAYDTQVIASGVSGDLAYIVGIEHTTASVGGAPPLPCALRVTTIFRRGGGEWRVVHRHGDPLPDAGIESTRLQLSRLGSLNVGPDNAQ